MSGHQKWEDVRRDVLASEQSQRGYEEERRRIEAEMNQPRLIEQMYAFVTVDPVDNTEGVCAFMDPTTDIWMPMCGADLEMVEHLRPYAEITARATGQPVKLIVFSTRTDVEVIAP